LPVVGWLYVLLFHRKDPFAVYHLKQSIGLVLFLVMVTVGVAAVGWVLAWIPYMFVLSIALFSLVIAAYAFGIVVWIIGMANALRGQAIPLPISGGWANRLPIQ
jgi:uncharacterized membrane protein